MKKILLFITLFIYFQFFTQAPQIEWQKCLGGTVDEEANSIQQTADGGYIFVGYTQSNDGDITSNHGNNDVWVVKLDAMGVINWQKTLGGTAFESAFSIQQTTDGGYILAGNTYSNDGDVIGADGTENIWVVKLDATGSVIWQKALGGTSSDWTYSIQQITDGGYILVGSTVSTNGDVTGNHGGYDIWVVKLDVTGNIIWQKALGGTDSDYASSIQQTTDGGYILVGQVYSNDGDVTANHGDFDVWVVKLNAVGNITWQKTLGGTLDDQFDGGGSSIQQTTDGGYILGIHTLSNDGDVTGNHGLDDAWIVKLDATGNITWKKCLGGTGNDIPESIHQTNDGGYILGGITNSNDGDVTNSHGEDGDFWAVKLDATGNIIWQKTLGGMGTDWPYSIEQTIDGAYILAGYTESNDGDITASHGNEDVWVVKLSAQDAGIETISDHSFNFIYPNPTSGIIQISELYDTQKTTISIYDNVGKLLLKSNNTNAIDMSSFDNGMYQLVIKTDTFESTQKVQVIK